MPGREAVLWGRPVPPKDDAPRQSILHCLRMLAPFREAIPSCSHANSDMAEGERQFYAFIKGLYGEMYSDPAFFLIPQGEYDEYLQSLPPKEETGDGDDHKVDQKESRLRNRFQQAIRFYAAYLYELGTRAQSLDKGVLVLTAAAWQEARKAMEWPHLRGENGPRFQRLQVLGLDERQEPGLVYITCREFPKMLYGLWALCKAPQNKYHYMDYLRVDYRAALHGSPQPGDIFATLNPERAQSARIFHKTMTAQGLKLYVKPLREITSGSSWKGEYRREGRCIAGFYADPDAFTLCLYLGSPEKVGEASAALWARDPLLGVWFDSKFPERRCTCAHNCRVQLGDGPRRICGMACRAEILDPSFEDLQTAMSILSGLAPRPAHEGAETEPPAARP